MPRITKKQKEAGVPPRAKTRPANTTQAAAERKKGFQVGPAHAAKNAYLGKAKKIKADLIMRAKAKKNFAKVLKEEGMESSRLQRRDRPAATSGQDELESKEDEAPSTAAPTEQKRAPSSSWKGKSRADTTSSPPPPAPSTAFPTAPVRALSPSTIGPPMPLSSLRDLKKEAFAKYHSPRRKGGPSEAPQPRSRNVSAASGRSVGSVASMGGGRRGQPNMTARMGVLLEKIKRDRQ